jgi:hypothetical protein
MKKMFKTIGCVAAFTLALSAVPAFAGGGYSFSFGYSSRGGCYPRYYRPHYHGGWSFGYSHYAPSYWYYPPPVTHYRYYAPPPPPRVYYSNPPAYMYQGGTFYRY